MPSEPHYLQRLVRLLADFDSHAQAFREERADVMIEVGDGLRKMRLEAKVSLRQAALRLGCSAAFLSDLERGRRNQTIEWVKKIYAAMTLPNASAEGRGSGAITNTFNS